MVEGSNPVAVTSPSDFAPASSKEFLDIQATIECGFTLKRVRDMIKTYNLYLNFGNILAFLTGVHWTAKRELKSSDFILKSDTSLPSARISGEKKALSKN